MYYWPNRFKELHKYVSDCIPCKTRSMLKNKHPLQEIDIPLYPMAKRGLDLSGPLSHTFVREQIYDCICRLVQWLARSFSSYP